MAPRAHNRIPPIAGTANATSLIADGALIEVDGTAGEVRVIGADGTPRT
jgi:phosphohistidine swiveling domain-containing protein